MCWRRVRRLDPEIKLTRSGSEYLQPILDLRVQLADRSSRLRNLILLINERNRLGKLSQASRLQLSWDAERLSAGSVLWQHHTAGFAANDGDGQSDLLAAAILTYMDDGGDSPPDDAVRDFFKHAVR